MASTINFERFVAEFPFLGNEDLVPTPGAVEGVFIRRINQELLELRSTSYLEVGGLVHNEAEDLFFLLDQDGRLLTKVKPDVEKRIHGSLPDEIEDGESVAAAAARVGTDKVHTILRVSRGDVCEDGEDQSWYNLTVYKPARFDLPTWIAEHPRHRQFLPFDLRTRTR